MAGLTDARRTVPHFTINGVDCTGEIEKHLISVQLVDVMEGESDDLQITLRDKNGIFSNNWFGSNSSKGRAADSGGDTASGGTVYTVTAKIGLSVRSAAVVSDNNVLGTMPYGTTVTITEINNGWGKHTYNGAIGYSSMSYLKATEEKTTVAAISGGGGGQYAVGDKVTVNGRPQFTSYGEGSPGGALTNYEGTITRINSKGGVPYPICIDDLGWIAENQITTTTEQQTENITPRTTAAGFRKGTRIDFMIEQKATGGNKVQTYDDFELDTVALGFPSTFTIKATSLPHTSTVREQKKTRVFENKKNSEILQEVANDCGMKCFYDSEYDPLHERLEQQDCSDIFFLKWLAEKSGLALKATSNMLIMFDEAAYEAREIYRTYAKTDCISWDFKTGFADAAYSSCHVTYTTDSGEVIEYTYTPQTSTGGNGEVLEIKNEKVANVDEARILAMKRLREKNKGEFSASITLPGDCYICGGLTVELAEDFGGWSGKYIVDKATHTISRSNGYTVKLEMYRPLEGF